jgi:hypothetical protein
MENVDGCIVYNELGYSKGLKSFTEKQVNRWLRERLGESIPSSLAVRYRVSFDREGDTKLVGCRVELLFEDKVWIGFENASSADSALVRTLHRLSTVTNPFRIPEWTHSSSSLPKAG